LVSHLTIAKPWRINHSYVASKCLSIMHKRVKWCPKPCAFLNVFCLRLY
jgi:hypothetical protein